MDTIFNTLSDKSILNTFWLASFYKTLGFIAAADADSKLYKVVVRLKCSHLLMSFFECIGHIYSIAESKKLLVQFISSLNYKVLDVVPYVNTSCIRENNFGGYGNRN